MMNVDGYEDTVQARLMKLVTDQQIFADVNKAERIIDFQMLDALIETTLTTINEDLGAEISDYNTWLHQSSTKITNTNLNAPDAANQKKFTIKLINQLKILIDLLQLQAITKGAEKNKFA